MVIWRARHADLPKLLTWGEQFAAYHPLTRGAGMDAAAVGETLCAMMANPLQVILMHAHGAIGGALTPLWINPAVTVATELFWWAERDGVQLMKAFEAWAVEEGADLVQMIAILGAERDVTPLYDRARYGPSELTFTRAITRSPLPPDAC